MFDKKVPIEYMGTQPLYLRKSLFQKKLRFAVSVPLKCGFMCGLRFRYLLSAVLSAVCGFRYPPVPPPIIHAFFYKHQRYKHREAQNWPKNKHILCTTPEPRFRQIPIFKIWLFYDLLLKRNYSLMK